MAIGYHGLSTIRICEFSLIEINNTLKTREKGEPILTIDVNQYINYHGMRKKHPLANILSRIDSDKNHQQMLKLREESLMKNRMFT